MLRIRHGGVEQTRGYRGDKDVYQLTSACLHVSSTGQDPRLVPVQFRHADEDQTLKHWNIFWELQIMFPSTASCGWWMGPGPMVDWCTFLDVSLSWGSPSPRTGPWQILCSSTSAAALPPASMHMVRISDIKWRAIHIAIVFSFYSKPLRVWNLNGGRFFSWITALVSTFWMQKDLSGLFLSVWEEPITQLQPVTHSVRA